MDNNTSHAKKGMSNRAHGFFVGPTWLRIKLAIKPAIAITIALAIGQDGRVATLQGSTRYLSPIFATIFMPNKPRIQMIQLTLLGAFMIAAVIPFTMLAFLCAKATRDPARDSAQLQEYVADLSKGTPSGPAVFYQGKASAISAVFIFILAWVANVLKTLFFPLIFAFVASAIVGIVLLLEGLLFPEWSFFYTIVKSVLYNALIGLAVSLAVNTFLFPHNAREPFLRQTAALLDAVERVVSHHSKHFSTFHLRAKEANEKSERASSPRSDQEDLRRTDSAPSQEGNLPKTEDDILKLQDMRNNITSLAATLQLSKSMAKREVAYGHMQVSEIKSLYRHCTKLIVPVLACNLWAQIASSLREDSKVKIENRGEDFHGILLSLNVTGELNSTEREKLFILMEEHIAPRIIEFSASCTDAIEHIKRALQLGIYRRAPFLVRPFVTPPRAYDEEDRAFSDSFEAVTKRFWSGKHASKASYLTTETSSAATVLIFYMESVLYSMSLQLLEFCRWADEIQASGIMRKKRVILPTLQRFVKTIKRALISLKHHSEPDSGIKEHNVLSGLDETIQNDRRQSPNSAETLLNACNPEMIPRHTWWSGVLLILYRIKIFIFDSKVGGFGFRAAIAMTAAALPAFFPDSVAVFLRYRLLWIPLTVLLGLQPVLGKGLASLIMRIAGTLIGGVLGLLVVEIGRVPGGMIPVFFVTVLPLFYVVQLNQLLFLPVLLSIITEVLIVGYKLTADTLGLAALASSGQVYLEPPALMGYRILLTLAGIVVAFIFSIFPSLPTARSLLRQDFSKHLFGSGDLYQLQSLRTIGAQYELPDDLHLKKAVAHKQIELLKISAATREYTGLTSFEISPRGVFPLGQWKKLLALLDNLDTTLAVNNALYTTIRTTDPDDKMKLNHLFSHLTSEKFFRVVSGTLLSLGDSVGRWRPLPPVLGSPVAAHMEKQKLLAAAADSFRQTGGQADLDPGVVTHFGAYMVSNAILARCLEDLVKETEALVGHSHINKFLLEHRKNGKMA